MIDRIYTRVTRGSTDAHFYRRRVYSLGFVREFEVNMVELYENSWWRMTYIGKFSDIVK
jgi:hypothetical protein